MTFQCNEYAFHMVCCNVSTRQRKDKPPRNDTVLLWMGTNLDSYFRSTAGCNPACFNCSFNIEHTESSAKQLLPLVQTFGTVHICHTAGIVIVDGTHQPSMQPLHDECYHRMVNFAVTTTYVIPFGASVSNGSILGTSRLCRSAWQWPYHIKNRGFVLRTAHLSPPILIRHFRAWYMKYAAFQGASFGGL